jgi:hypothetical protein
MLLGLHKKTANIISGFNQIGLKLAIISCYLKVRFLLIENFI